MKISSFAAFLVIFAAGALSAGNPFRLDITSKDVPMKPGDASEGIKISNATFVPPERRAMYITLDGPQLPTDEWKTVTFSFTPEADGKVDFILRGPFMRTPGKTNVAQGWILFDDIQVTGAEFKNGSFEIAGQGNNPLAYWRFHPTKGDDPAAQVVGDAADGKNSLKVWHNGVCSQWMTVKKGVPVTVTLKVKSGEYLPATN